MKKEKSLTVVSDFNVEPLVGFINNDALTPELEASSIGFGNPVGSLIGLLEKDHEADKYVLIWTLPESISVSLAESRKMLPLDHENAIHDVEKLCNIVTRLAGKVAGIFICNWRIPYSERGYGLLELQEGLGLRSLIHAMNGVLYSKLNSLNNVHLIDTDFFISPYKFSAQMWYLAKVPFELEVLKKLSYQIKNCLRSILGNSRKLVVCDLDDTLWGGVVGDCGWENLKLGGHDPIGEAYKDFQSVLKGLRNRGILLAIISKNTERIALRAIESHPEMVLRIDDFIGWRINWTDKASNLSSLVKEINIGLDSVVFLDDNPSERARIRDSFPHVLVPDLPGNILEYPQFLRSFECFDSMSISLEDRSRTEMYNAEKRRKKELSQVDDDIITLEEWLKGLGLEVMVEPLHDSNIVRASQLFNKTNQMNLSTRRMPENSLFEWAFNENVQVFVFNVSDKFGAYGLTGLASIEIEKQDAYLKDFILSCRVMGKGVETAMLHHVSVVSQNMGANQLISEYIKTPKNLPCEEFFRNSKMEENAGGNTFSWVLNKPYPKPDNMKIRNTFENGA